MDHLSPLKTLDRGYAIVTDKNHRILRSTQSLKKGDKIEAKLAKGKLEAEVIQLLE